MPYTLPQARARKAIFEEYKLSAADEKSEDALQNAVKGQLLLNLIDRRDPWDAIKTQIQIRKLSDIYDYLGEAIDQFIAAGKEGYEQLGKIIDILSADWGHIDTASSQSELKKRAELLFITAAYLRSVKSNDKYQQKGEIGFASPSLKSWGKDGLTKAASQRREEARTMNQQAWAEDEIKLQEKKRQEEDKKKRAMEEKIKALHKQHEVEDQLAEQKLREQQQRQQIELQEEQRKTKELEGNAKELEAKKEARKQALSKLTGKIDSSSAGKTTDSIDSKQPNETKETALRAQQDKKIEAAIQAKRRAARKSSLFSEASGRRLADSTPQTDIPLIQKANPIRTADSVDPKRLAAVTRLARESTLTAEQKIALREQEKKGTVEKERKEQEAKVKEEATKQEQLAREKKASEEQQRKAEEAEARDKAAKKEQQAKEKKAREEKLESSDPKVQQRTRALLKSQEESKLTPEQKISLREKEKKDAAEKERKEQEEKAMKREQLAREKKAAEEKQKKEIKARIEKLENPDLKAQQRTNALLKSQQENEERRAREQKEKDEKTAQQQKPKSADELAAEKKATAEYRLGVTYQQEGRKKKAAESFANASKAGNAHASFEIAKMYMDGDGVPSNLEFAAIYLRVAHQQKYSSLGEAKLGGVDTDINAACEKIKKLLTPSRSFASLLGFALVYDTETNFKIRFNLAEILDEPKLKGALKTENPELFEKLSKQDPWGNTSALKDATITTPKPL